MRRSIPKPDVIVVPSKWERVKAFGNYLHQNKLAMVFMFVLLLTMIVMETRVTAFGYDFGFKSNIELNNCNESPKAVTEE